MSEQIRDLIARIEAKIEPWDAPLCRPTEMSMRWPTPTGGCQFCDMRITDKAAAEGRQEEAWSRPMIVCGECGNKRCPKAWYHRHKCTASNETGQDGDFPEHVTIADAKELLVALKALASIKLSLPPGM
jgi:hypothetical protein